MRRLLIVALFVGLLAASWWLDRRAAEGPAPTGDLGFALTEVSAELGLDFEHSAADIDEKVNHIADHIMGVGAALSVADVDGDGWLDAFFSNSDFGADNGLFLNREGERFENVTADWGLTGLNSRETGVSMGSLFCDLENDGDPDLLLYRYGQLGLFENEGGRFVDRSEASGVARWMNSNAACALDHDRDGLLDLYVGGYYKARHDLWDLDTTVIMHNSGEFADNGGRNVLLHNRGDLNFADVSDAQGLDQTLWTFATLSADLDEDGWPDLYVANDYGSEQLLLNREGRGFEESETVSMGHDSKSGMSIALGNVRNDDTLAVFIANISADGWIFHGNNLRINRLPKGGGLSQEARGQMVNTGWAWGAQFGDLDLDGYQDLFVVNGFISGDPKRQYWYEASKLASGTGSILEDAASWAPFDGRSQSGYERSAVLRNKAGRAFVDVAGEAGITDVLDGRSVVLADYRNVGVLDAMIANQEARALYYRNAPAASGWVELKLEGTQSNRDAVGAAVALTFGTQRQRQIVTAGSGFSSQTDLRLHFGLADHAGPVSATVTWPSGAVQELAELEQGRLHPVLEPEALSPQDAEAP